MELPTSMTEFFPIIVEAAQGSNWHILSSSIIMVLVFMVNKTPFFNNLLKGKAKIWVAAVSGMLLAIATTAFTTNGNWILAIMNGFATGLSATGLFELVRRKASGVAIDADNDGVLDPLNENAE